MIYILSGTRVFRTKVEEELAAQFAETCPQFIVFFSEEEL